MDRIRVGGIKDEINSFVDGVMTLDDLRAFGWVAVAASMFGPEVGTGQVRM